MSIEIDNNFMLPHIMYIGTYYVKDEQFEVEIDIYVGIEYFMVYPKIKK